MTDLGAPGRAPRPYGGEVRRREIRRTGGLPREGEVIVYELRYHDGWHLEIEVAWRGVPAGAPPALPETRVGIAHDSVDVGQDVELARVVAGDLEHALRTGATVDAQHVLARARRRRYGG